MPTTTDAQATAAFNTAGASKTSSSALTWNAGDKIVYIAGAEGSCTLAVPTATGLTFTSRRANAVGSTCAVQLAAATAATSDSQTINGSNSSSTLHWGFQAWAIGNHNGEGASVEQHTTAHTANLAQTGTDSAVLWAGFDFGAAGAPAATPAATTTRQSIDDGALYSLLIADLLDQPSTGTIAYGITTASASAVTIVALEILNAVAAAVTAPIFNPIPFMR